MKMLMAGIRPERLGEVQEALAAQHIYLMTVSEVRGIGKQRGEREVVRDHESVMSVTKLKLEIAVNDVFVDAAVDAVGPQRPLAPRPPRDDAARGLT